MLYFFVLCVAHVDSQNAVCAGEYPALTKIVMLCWLLLLAMIFCVFIFCTPYSDADALFSKTKKGKKKKNSLTNATSGSSAGGGSGGTSTSASVKGEAAGGGGKEKGGKEKVSVSCLVRCFVLCCVACCCVVWRVCCVVLCFMLLLLTYKNRSFCNKQHVCRCLLTIKSYQPILCIILLTPSTLQTLQTQ